MSAILSQKADYDKKINEIEKKITDHKHEKHITTPEFNKQTAEIFAARSAQANLVAIADFDNKQSSFHQEIISNETKRLIVENELKKIRNMYFNLVFR